MSGVNGACDRECTLGRPHDIECRNYIEVDLPCPVCAGMYGRHAGHCPLGYGLTSPDSGSDQ